MNLIYLKLKKLFLKVIKTKQKLLIKKIKRKRKNKLKEKMR